jgi:hypothetical protein
MSPDSLRIDLSDFPRPTLEEGAPGTGMPEGRAPRGNVLFRALRWAVLLSFLGVLPFFTLLRVSVFLLQRYGFGSWFALGGGAAATLLLLLLYLVAASLRLGGKGRVPRALVRGATILVGAYCMFTLLYLSAGNAKTEEIRDTYTSLNPLLRVGVSTLLLIDRDGVLTATGRELEDYSEWGLFPNDASLHLPQADGYVYAVDIRTLDRPEWRNRAVSLYFRTMGFQTLRHVGTADHLHVSLPPPL